jgi:hypothetical protein
MQLLTSQLAAANFVTDVDCGPVIHPGDAARLAAAIIAAHLQLAAAGPVRGRARSPPGIPVTNGKPLSATQRHCPPYTDTNYTKTRFCIIKIIHKIFTKKDLTYSQICARARAAMIRPGTIFGKRQKGRLLVLFLFGILYAFNMLNVCNDTTTLAFLLIFPTTTLKIKWCALSVLGRTATVWTSCHSSSSSSPYPKIKPLSYTTNFELYVV